MAVLNIGRHRGRSNVFALRIRNFYVYIMGSRSGVLYTGVTSDLEGRVAEHKSGHTPGFTQKYRVRRLLYFERFDEARWAIQREKQIKGWTRSRKIELISTINPNCRDLSLEWTEPNPSS